RLQRRTRSLLAKMGSQIYYKSKMYSNLSCSMCRRDCYVTHVSCGCTFDPICLHHEQELRSCSCKSDRIVYVREDILELEALYRKFEQDIRLDKETSANVSYKQAAISDIGDDHGPSVGTNQDISNSEANLLEANAANGGKSSPATSSLTSFAQRDGSLAAEPKAHAARTDQIWSITKQFIKTSSMEGNGLLDGNSSCMADACNEISSCNASPMEYSGNSDSDSEIFRVKRRSSILGRSAPDTKTTNMSEQKVF
uniref:Zinc finger C5HC2-type domain-containing protein n=1 Tax=Aegilops tauschii subsp. strangulata TaxID=200361 RepID=A0A452YQX5_AEGTS